MPIEITGHPSSQLPTASEGAAIQVGRTEATASQRETGTPSSLDTVNLTDTAAMLQALDQVIVNVPVVDTARVESVQRSLANGQFDFNDAGVAEQLFTKEVALYGA